MISVARRVAQWVNGFGYGRCVIKSDQEPAIADMQYSEMQERPRSLEEVWIHVRSTMGNDDEDGNIVALEHSFVGGSKSNGAVENAIKRTQGQVRTLILFLEESTGKSIDIDLNIWQWLVECAADIFYRYEIGHDGLAAYKRAKGRESTVPIAAFGERAFYHMTKRISSTRPKSEPAWLEGYTSAPCG